MRSPIHSEIVVAALGLLISVGGAAYTADHYTALYQTLTNIDALAPMPGGVAKNIELALKNNSDEDREVILQDRAVRHEQQRSLHVLLSEVTETAATRALHEMLLWGGVVICFCILVIRANAARRRLRANRNEL